MKRRAFRQVLAICPEHASAHLELAAALYGKGQVAEASAELQETLTLDRTIFVARMELANIYREKGEYARLEALLRAAPNFGSLSKDVEASIIGWAKSADAGTGPG